ncbi:hypothetical protein BDZ91DRAFT_740032 [Kalaharituber pfeilii]|nr:hypothetical protein BDZ91DRAFT_740032 [Kalaharituber pfeilii]
MDRARNLSGQACLQGTVSCTFVAQAATTNLACLALRARRHTPSPLYVADAALITTSPAALRSPTVASAFAYTTSASRPSTASNMIGR